MKSDFGDPDDQAELYTDFDALILPRRYGGLCLPMNEALLSGLPVIMPDCSPNNDVLPTHWLIPATRTGSFMARTEIELHEADPRALGAQLDQLAGLSSDELIQQKAEAYALGYERFSMEAVRPVWEMVLRG